MKKVVLLGSGALKIGEAGEFDYSGSQAIKALKEEGVNVILVNPNIATIQTSAGLADEIYFLPVTPYFVEKVIEKERPDGILLSFGGQTALNCGISLYEKGIFHTYNVRILGTPMEAILATEDRQAFAQKLISLGLLPAKGAVAKTFEEARAIVEAIGFPVMVRAGFALGGTGSGIAKNMAELKTLADHAFAASTQIVVEESLWGWKEIEYEVVRDKDNNCITVCNMENFDPVGIHTGESIVIAPSQTLTNEEYYTLRKKSIDVIRNLGIVGECNIQFALHPHKNELRVIEVNARLSRSSALASKATGYPLAYVAAKLAMGRTLPELPNSITKKTKAFFEPSLDYVVVKMPRWDLDKFVSVNATIGSEMKSVGEVMSIGRTFEESIQKATRMLGNGFKGVADKAHTHGKKDDLLESIKTPTTIRLFAIVSALIAGATVEEISFHTGIDGWFLSKLKNIAMTYKDLKHKDLDKDLLLRAKKQGFSDMGIAELTDKTPAEVRSMRKRMGIIPSVKRIDTTAAEFPAATNYLYTTYHGNSSDQVPYAGKKVAVLGCGPYAIGTSVEFDWCAVNVVTSLRKRGIHTIMINCNPETVSTDFDVSDTLYFEELSQERVLDIIDLEKCPVVVSVGGQVPNNLAPKLSAEGVTILGTDPEDIHRAEHRKSFSKLLDDLGIRQPGWHTAKTKKEAVTYGQKLGYPVLVRPSFVLSGKAMSILDSESELIGYLDNLDLDLSEFPLVITQFLSGAREFDYDGIAHNGVVVVKAISEHVEGGGVHSGDSTIVYPTFRTDGLVLLQIEEAVKKIVKELHVNGPFNVQMLEKSGDVFIIECNLRASRSMPMVSKAMHINFMEVATAILLKDKKISVPRHVRGFFTVKVPQFSFHKLRGADPTLRVEMTSTGEVASMGREVYEAYLKAMLSTGVKYPENKTVFVSLGGARAKSAFLYHCKKLVENEFTIFATSGTHFFLKENGILSRHVGKIFEGVRPNITDLLSEKKIDFLIVIPEKQTDHRTVSTFKKTISDGYMIRRLAIDMGVPIFTAVSSSKFFVDAVTQYTPADLEILPWSAYGLSEGDNV